uniref:ANF_receptor domain-containing protein n=1 Tax=Globodera pallida TaxID=36090 RepID=A0A183CB15_GLOPA
MIIQKACQPLPLKLAQLAGHAHLVEGPSCCCGCNCLPWKFFETIGKQQEEEEGEEEKRRMPSSSSDDAGSDYQADEDVDDNGGREGRKTENPFSITILKARPVVDEGIEEVYRRQLAPINSLTTHFNDTQMSDAHGPNVAINMLVENRVDVIIGYAFVYAMAPVARMSPFWRDKDSYGIPVITSIGLTTNLDNRNDYKLMTRISSPYKIVKDSLLALYAEMHWRKTAYVFHDERHDSVRSSSIPYGECYLLMSSLQSHLYHLTRMEHNHFMFNELKHDRHKIGDNLKKASMLSNGLKISDSWLKVRSDSTVPGGGAKYFGTICISSFFDFPTNQL